MRPLVFLILNHHVDLKKHWPLSSTADLGPSRHRLDRGVRIQIPKLLQGFSKQRSDLSSCVSMCIDEHRRIYILYIYIYMHTHTHAHLTPMYI